MYFAEFSGNMADLDPFAFFKAECAHTDIDVRSEAVRRVVQIICLMDTTLVVSGMLPFLQGTCNVSSRILSNAFVCLRILKRLY